MMDEAELCVVCNKLGPNFFDEDGKRRRKLKKSAPATPRAVRKSTRLEEKAQASGLPSYVENEIYELLQPQLRVIFLLQQVFNYPVHHDNILETMKLLGDPSEWFEICKVCAELVDAGIEIFRELKRYEEEHKRIVETLERKLSSSICQKPRKFQNCFTSPAEGEDSKVEVRRRVEFRNKVRRKDTSSFDNYCEVKLEVESDNPVSPEPWNSEYPSGSHFACDPSRDEEIITQEQTSIGRKRKRGRPRKEKCNLKGEPLEHPEPEDETLLGYKKQDVDDKNSDNSFSDGENDEEVKVKRRKLQCPKKNRKSLKRETHIITDSKIVDDWFFENCSQFLDMSLVVYPPTCEEDKASIPKVIKLYTSEDRYGVKTGGFPCPSCKKSYCNKYLTIAHIHRDHLGIAKPWKCNRCSHMAAVSRRFRHHVHDHEIGVRKFCEICRQFSSKKHSDIDTHVINHQKNVASPTCHICQSSFNAFKHYIKHMIQEHGLMYRRKKFIQEVDSVCQFCSKSFRTLRKLKFHLLKEHNFGENDGSFPICAECGEMFCDGSALKYHKLNRHSSGERNCFCEHCGKGCMTTSVLMQHIKYAHTEEQQNCKICGMQFQNSLKLEKHLRRRHQETISMSTIQLEEYINKKNEVKPFQCSQCMEGFSFSFLLYHHYRTSHPEVTDKFKCDICGKGFSRQSSVIRHKEVNHLQLKIACKYCGNLYSKGNSLDQHTRSHCPVKKKMKQLASAPHKSTSKTEDVLSQRASETFKVEPEHAMTYALPIIAEEMNVVHSS